MQLSQAAYEETHRGKLKEGPKLLYSYFWRKKVGCPTVGPLRIGGQALSEDPVTMTEVFVSSFESV